MIGKYLFFLSLALGLQVWSENLLTGGLEFLLLSKLEAKDTHVSDKVVPIL